MSKKHPSFFEYLNARGGLEEKPKTTETGDTGPTPEPKDAQKKNQKMKGKKQPQIKEYMDANGKVVENPPVKKVPDYTGPNPSAPPSCGKGCNPSPYRAAAGKTGETRESGLGDKGAANLKYEPKTDTEFKPIPSWPKTKTEHFLNKTKNMSIGEFTSYVVKECVCDTGQLEKFSETAAAIKQSPKLTQYLVHEMKRKVGLKGLLEAILSHPESYDDLTNLFEKESRCAMLAKAMNKQIVEAVGPPMGPEEKKEKPKGKNPFDSLADLDDGGEDEEEDEEEDDAEDSNFPVGKFGDDEEDDEFGGDEFGDEEEDLGDEDELGDEDLGDEDELGDEEEDDDDDLGDDEDLGDEEGDGFAGQNMVKAMSGFGPMRDTMKKVVPCGHCGELTCPHCGQPIQLDSEE